MGTPIKRSARPGMPLPVVINGVLQHYRCYACHWRMYRSGIWPEGLECLNSDCTEHHHVRTIPE